MYIKVAIMYINVTIAPGSLSMATARPRAHKHFQLDAAKIKRAQKALRASNETETIERALDLVITEEKQNRLALAANERFLRSGIAIRDVFGNLD
jgi:hypothetical protein